MTEIQVADSFDPSKPSILYGAGSLTRMALALWPSEITKPIAIIDKNFKGRSLNLNGIPIFNLDYFRTSKISTTQIILCAFKANIFEIHDDLNQFGLGITATIYDLLNLYIPEKFSNGWEVSANKSEFQSEILSISQFFSDTKSQKILEDVFLWRAFRKIKRNIYDRLDDEQSKYINPIINDYLRQATLIIDGGAYDGNSSREFSKISHAYCKFILYEPDLISFNTLRKGLFGSFDRKIHRAALSDKISNSELFFSTGGLSSRLVEKIEFSNSYVRTTTIDHDLCNKAEAFNKNIIIKLHIEGKELNALHGAGNTIKDHKPTWIINCSHNREQLIEIPKVLRSHGYTKIYLRCHSLFGEGLTLYALPY